MSLVNVSRNGPGVNNANYLFWGKGATATIDQLQDQFIGLRCSWTISDKATQLDITGGHLCSCYHSHCKVKKVTRFNDIQHLLQTNTIIMCTNLAHDLFVYVVKEVSLTHRFHRRGKLPITKLNVETVQCDRYVHMATINPTSTDPDLPVDDKNSHPHSLEENVREAKFTESVSKREDDIVDAFEDSPLLGNGQSHSIMLMLGSQLLITLYFVVQPMYRTGHSRSPSFLLM